MTSSMHRETNTEMILGATGNRLDFRYWKLRRRGLDTVDSMRLQEKIRGQELRSKQEIPFRIVARYKRIGIDASCVLAVNRVAKYKVLIDISTKKEWGSSPLGSCCSIWGGADPSMLEPTDWMFIRKY